MVKKIHFFYNKLKEDRVGEYSAQCSYYMILAFIPFLVLLLTMVQYIGIKPQNIYNIADIIIPSTIKEFMIQLIQEIYSKTLGTISISIIFTVLSAGKGLYALTNGLDRIYEFSKEKYLKLKIKSILNTILFLILIMIALILHIFVRGVIELLKEKIDILNSFSIVFSEQIILIVYTFLMYLMIFKLIPSKKTKIKSQIPGAIIGSISLNLISIFFSKYLIIFKGFSLMYGSLTAIMLIILWIYACNYIIFLGAEINNILERDE